MSKFLKQNDGQKPAKLLWLRWLLLACSYFLVEGFALFMLAPGELMCLAFGGVWAVLLASLVIQLPKIAGRIAYGVTYFALAGWTIAQTGYHAVFGKMMWIGDAMFAGEGGAFLGDVLSTFPPEWYIGGVVLLVLGVVVLLTVPGGSPALYQRQSKHRSRRAAPSAPGDTRASWDKGHASTNPWQ